MAMIPAPSVLLASASPRRRRILEALPWPVTVQPADVTEEQAPDEDGVTMVRRLAALKAFTLFTTLPPAPPLPAAAMQLIVGADTAVEIEGRILGKPRTRDEAWHYLALLRTASHTVHSGLCLINARTGQTRACTHTSRLTMRQYTDAEITAYVNTGTTRDKAGGYALQDQTFRPVAVLEGCAASVIGFPLGEFADLCRTAFACPLPDTFPAVCRRLTGYACCRQAAPSG